MWIGYLQKETTINGEYFDKLLDLFKEDLEKKRSQLFKKDVVFHQDNANVNTCLVAIVKFNQMSDKLLSYAKFSPDSAHSDYFYE